MTSTVVDTLAQLDLLRANPAPSGPEPSGPEPSGPAPGGPAPGGPVPGGSVPTTVASVEREIAPVGITDAAALVGLTAHTLRYYEQQGLVSPERNSAGYREYSPDTLRRLVFLARMRVSGMPMRELRRYIGLVEEGDATIPDRRAMMRAQLDRIRLQIRELELSLETTEFKIRTYDGHPEP